MPVYSAREDRAARDAWVLLAGRRRWVGREVSGVVVADAFAAIEAAPTIAAQRGVARALFRRVFPSRLSFRWRGDPVEVIDALPHAEWLEVLRSFFGSALRRRPAPGAPPIASSTSSSSAGRPPATGSVPGSASS